MDPKATVLTALKLRSYLEMVDLSVAPDVTSGRLYLLNGTLMFDEDPIGVSDPFSITWEGSGNEDIFEVAVTNTGTGHLFNIDVTAVHTGALFDIAYSTAAVTADMFALDLGTGVAASAFAISAAGARTDAIFKLDDASTSNAGAFDLNLTGAFTTAYAFDLNASGNHTAGLFRFLSNSNDTGTRSLGLIHNDNTAATGTTPFEVINDAVVSTNFKRGIKIAGVTIWVSNGNTPNAALSGTAGDICLGGDSGKIYFCTGTTNWTSTT